MGDSRANRDTLIQAARATCSEAVAPLKLKLRSDIEALGEEPPDGPRFSREAELWWTYQHAKTALSRTYGNAAGVYEDAKREAIEDARNFHRKSVWQWRDELYAAIEPLKVEAYKIFKGPYPLKDLESVTVGCLPVDRPVPSSPTLESRGCDYATLQTMER